MLREVARPGPSCTRPRCAAGGCRTPTVSTATSRPSTTRSTGIEPAGRTRRASPTTPFGSPHAPCVPRPRWRRWSWRSSSRRSSGHGRRRRPPRWPSCRRGRRPRRHRSRNPLRSGGRSAPVMSRPSGQAVPSPAGRVAPGRRRGRRGAGAPSGPRPPPGGCPRRGRAGLGRGRHLGRGGLPPEPGACPGRRRAGARSRARRPLAEAAPPAAPGAPGVGAGAAAPAEPLDLNAATPAALDQLPGVGPVLAGRIVAWRAAHGRFTSVDELGEVEGIGPKALERLRALVRV